MKFLLSRLLAFVMLVFSIVFYSVAVNQDRILIKALYPKDPNYSQYIDSVFNGIPYYEQWEKLAVEYFNFQINNKQLDCVRLKKYANKLLTTSDRSSQGYYLLTACAEREGRSIEAMNFAKQALKYDPLNTQYMMALAVLNLNANNLAEAKKFIDMVEAIDPNTFNFKNIRNALNEKLNKSTKLE